MNTDKLIAEARAKIIWGDEPSSVRDFLTSNGMSEADADANLAEFVLERSAEIRRLGIRDVLIGVVLLGGAGIFFYLLSRPTNTHSVRISTGKLYGVLGVAACYGFWRLINGIIRLLRPAFERGSIQDLSE
jgi:hypothetical protein